MDNEELLLKLERLERVNVNLENENFRLNNKVKNQAIQLSRHCDNAKDSKDEIKRLSKELLKKEILIKKTLTLISKIEDKYSKKV